MDGCMHNQGTKWPCHNGPQLERNRTDYVKIQILNTGLWRSDRVWFSGWDLYRRALWLNVWCVYLNWFNSQIPQCTCFISHNAPLMAWVSNYWMVHCGIWNRCIVGFVRLIYSVWLPWLGLFTALYPNHIVTWWRHQMETFSICAGNSPVTGEFRTQRPVTRSFDVFFDLRLNKRLSKQWWGWWFETPSRPLWRHCNACASPRYSLSNSTAAFVYAGSLTYIEIGYWNISSYGSRCSAE